MNIQRILKRLAIVAVATVVWVCGIGAPLLRAQAKAKTQPACCGAKKKSGASKKATAKFAVRADALLATTPTSKGQWGLLIVDAESGNTLYEQNADKYFVPASNMKLFTTALALAKLGPEYRFHTTLEARGQLTPEGRVDGDLVLVGRGDPNLSNRKFPFVKQPEQDGPPDKVLIELADAAVSKGLREIAGDVVAD